MFVTCTRRLILAAVAAFALFAITVDGQANPVNQKFNFRLTKGDIREFPFTPGAAGQIRADADFRGAGVIRKEVAIKMKLIKPDGTIAKEAVGGSPLFVSFNLSASEQQKFKGQRFKVRLENNVPQKDQDTITGDLTIKFDDGKATVLDAKNLDVGPKATQERAFSTGGRSGRLTIDVSFRDGILNGKEVISELVQVSNNKILAKADGDSKLKLVANLSGNEGQLKVRITNKQTARTVRGIDLLGVIQP